MKCPECGMVNKEGSRFCSNCGAPLVEKKRVKKGKGFILAVAVVVVVVVAVAGYFVVFSHETERANELVDLANREIERGNEFLVNDVSVKLAEFREVDFDVVSESEVDGEVTTVSGWRQDAVGMRTTIGRVKEHFEKAKGYYEETKGLRLPRWYHDYVELKIKALEKDLERMEKIEELLGNYVVYYGFAESYLRGERALMEVQDELDEGNSYVQDGKYSDAVDAYRDALSDLRDSQGYFSAAGEVIDLDYMDDLEEYLEGLDSALEGLVEATELLEVGDLFGADALLGGVDVELAELEVPEGLEGGLEEWYDVYIEGVIEKIEELLEEVKELEEKAEELYEENA